MPYPKTVEQQTKQDAPMTGSQRTYLKDLCKQAGEEFYEELTKVQASRKIEELVRARREKAGSNN